MTASGFSLLGGGCDTSLRDTLERANTLRRIG